MRPLTPMAVGVAGGVAVGVVLIVAVAACGQARAAASDDEVALRLARGYAAMESFDRATAREAARWLDDQGVGGAEAALYRALLARDEGDHAAALAWIQDAPPSETIDRVRASIEAGVAWMGEAEETRSEHFIVRHAPGVDAIMVPRAVSVLESSYETLGRDLGLVPDEPVIVEIYPTSAAFAAAAGLPPEAVANDTIGLCRFDRIMITSPMAAPFGYPWADTLCHEYAHHLVNHIGRGRVPVWLHEGIASFAQRRWRGETALVLDPAAEGLLLEAVRSDSTVGVDEIGTCLACLESKERVQLAFAQVHTMVDHLVRSRGIGALLDVLAACRVGADATDAMGASWEGGYDAFVGSWAADVLRRRSDHEAAVLSLQLDRPPVDDGQVPAADSMLTARPDGAAHARLGDLLLDRQQHGAALLEYRRAADNLTEVSPSLACKQAHVLRLLDRNEEAREVLAAARALYPEFEPLAVHLARVLEELGERPAALQALDDAELLNPFDPRIHAWRLEWTGDPTQAEAAARALKTLQGVLR
jgi:tetratricopeptide (TPR) repeat protein